MKINIKKIIFFLVIIYGILAGKNICQATNHIDECSFCKSKFSGYSDVDIKLYNLRPGQHQQLEFGMWKAIFQAGYQYYTSANSAGIIKFESQKTGEATSFLNNVAGNRKKVEGWDNDGKITIQALKKGDIVIYRDKAFKSHEKAAGFHIRVKQMLDTTNDTKRSTMDDVTKNINGYKPGDIDSGSASKIESKTSKILTVISNIGIAISVIILAILGVKYMFGSVEDKAEYKQDMIPYIIGALLLFGITGFLKILIAIGEKIGTT